LPERFKVMCEHSELFEELLGGIKNFALMKKHFKAYVEGFPGAKELRTKLMETTNSSEIKSLVKEFLATVDK
ncbi:MAG: tRNA-dihydrouridine synthase, partial [Candidatus Pacebacteria bacterium]|nr:tRNA-dihydrouridine synthase [Candidatus Paceibacterota bacterium]